MPYSRHIKRHGGCSHSGAYTGKPIGALNRHGLPPRMVISLVISTENQGDRDSMDMRTTLASLR